ncbi:MAG TPA: septum formation family protein [Micromonosporaceae bacterium]|nr:septum formation family protein [Micromonosporaceae bacterium]
MRRRLTAVALSGVAALVLSGCATPAGVDGNLIDDWAAVSEPEPFVPEADVCHLIYRDVGYLSSYQPVDCAEKHLVETVHVGTFTGESAALAKPPVSGSPARRAAWGECDKKASEVLGADWRSAMLGLTLVLPSPDGWSGGARWFRCDLGEALSLDNNMPRERTGSLKGLLRETSPLSLGCFNAQLYDDYIMDIKPVDCDKPHDSEFAGIYLAPEQTWDALEKSTKNLHRQCRKIIAKYAKVPERTVEYRIGSVFYYPSETDWADGDRGVRCLLWDGDRKLIGSAKGAGAKVLPIG